MGGHGIAASVTSKAGRAGNSDALENLARIGMIAYGVVHLLVAWLALQLAWGGGGGSRPTSPARCPRSPSSRSASRCCGCSPSGWWRWPSGRPPRSSLAQRLVGLRQAAHEGDTQVASRPWPRRSSTSRWPSWRSSSPSAAASPARSRSSSTPPASSAGPAAGSSSRRRARAHRHRRPARLQGRHEELPQADRPGRGTAQGASSSSPGSGRSASRPRASRSALVGGLLG